jgi:hypothetical protein
MMAGAARITLCILGIAALPIWGCAPATVNSNGDRGTLISTLTKLADPDNNIGSLNSAELQILFEQLPSLSSQLSQFGIELPDGITLPALSDAEAEALEQFLDDYGVNTYEDLADLATAVESGQVQIPAPLMDAWEAFVAQFGRPRPS